MELAAKSVGVDSGALTARSAGAFAVLARKWRQFRAYRQTMEELTAMDDRELDDLGLRAEMFPRLAREASREV